MCKGCSLFYRGAYTQETRDVILSLDRANKTAPNGKQILKNVGVAMYLGAKIGFLGQNGGFLTIVVHHVFYSSNCTYATCDASIDAKR